MQTTILSEQTLEFSGEYFSSVHDSSLRILCCSSPVCHEQCAPWEATSTALVASWSRWSSWLTYWLWSGSGFHHGLELLEVLGERQQKESKHCWAPLKVFFFSAVFVQGAWVTWSYPGIHFLKLHKTNPLRLCVLAVCWRVPVLWQPWEEKFWPPGAGTALQLPLAMQKGQETKCLGNWVLKVLSSGGANISPCKTPPRCIFSKGCMVSAKRGARPCTTFTGRQGQRRAGPRLPGPSLRVACTAPIEAILAHCICVPAHQ